MPAAPAPRLARLPVRRLWAGQVRVAAGLRVRLLGLALLPRGRAGAGLLIPRCASVHTFGMRFALDLYFLDGEGRILRVCRGVPPCRLRWCRGARTVLEIPSEQGGESAPPAP